MPNQQRLLAAARARRGRGRAHHHREPDAGRPRPLARPQALAHPRAAAARPRRRSIAELAPAATRSCCPRPRRASSTRPISTTSCAISASAILIVAGIVTDQCVDMAVRDARRPRLSRHPGRAMPARPTAQERHEAALRAFGGYCWITDTDDRRGPAARPRLAERIAATERRSSPAIVTTTDIAGITRGRAVPRERARRPRRPASAGCRPTCRSRPST